MIVWPLMGPVVPPLPPPPSQNVAHTFVFSGLRVDLKRPRGVRKTQRSPRAPIVVPGEAGPAPLPSARNDSRVAETKAVVADTPVKIAFDPPIQAGNARMTAYVGPSGLLGQLRSGPTTGASFAGIEFYRDASRPVPMYRALVVPIIHETHFFLLHRALHWGPLYRLAHSVHHNSVNPSPFSSLSMHPIELFGYLGVALWHLIIPSNPILALYQLHYAGFGAIPGHIGFDKIEVTDDAAIDSHAYVHYLHHKYFEVNYGDGLIPFDKWLGTFHDGSREREAQMQARFEKKRARVNAKQQPAA